MSGETKWTPGPWAVNQGRVWVCTIGNNSDDPAVFSTVEVKEGEKFPFGDKLADAHLIAAAPDLYVALTEMMSGRMNGPDSYLIWKQAEAALAKARGEQP